MGSYSRSDVIVFISFTRTEFGQKFIISECCFLCLNLFKGRDIAARIMSKFFEGPWTSEKVFELSLAYRKRRMKDIGLWPDRKKYEQATLDFEEKWLEEKAEQWLEMDKLREKAEKENSFS